MKKIVEIKVPATSANLGPGFDMLGMALGIYNNFKFEIKESGLDILGCSEEYANESNLAIRAFDLTLAYGRKHRSGLRLEIDSNIPISRGLGSSASLIVAGALAANVLYDLNFSKEKILSICNEIEGHPDNLAAAIYGGMVASLVEGTTNIVMDYPVDKSWHFTLVIPEQILSTEEARSILPKEIAFSQGIFNMTRLALLFKALESGDENLMKLVEDKLHEPYRQNLIKDFSKVKEAALAVGACNFFISGAGSSCLCISKEPIDLELSSRLKNIDVNWDVLAVIIDREGSKYKESA